MTPWSAIGAFLGGLLSRLFGQKPAAPEKLAPTPSSPKFDDIDRKIDEEIRDSEPPTVRVSPVGPSRPPSRGP